MALIIAVLVAITLGLLVIGFVIPATIPRAFTSPDQENDDKINVCNDNYYNGEEFRESLGKTFPL